MRNQEAGCGAFHSTFNAPRNHPRPISARNRDSGAKCPCALRRLGQEAAAPCSGHVCAAARTNPWRGKDTHNRSAAAVRVPARQGYARRGTRCRHFVRHRLTRSTTAEKKKKLFQKNSPRNICLPCECLYMLRVANLFGASMPSHFSSRPPISPLLAEATPAAPGRTPQGRPPRSAEPPRAPTRGRHRRNPAQTPRRPPRRRSARAAEVTAPHYCP